MRRSCLAAVLFITCSGLAVTIRVPQEAPTIQAGLNSLADGDTVLIAVGVYVESLQAPPFHFTMKGDVVVDTGDYPRPVIDPSRLPRSDTLATLYLPEESSPVIEDVVFHNGPAMYPRNNFWPSGIYGFARYMVLRRCLLDSTSRGILHQIYFPHPHVIDTLQNCVFRNNQGFAIDALDWAIVATNCDFEFGSGWGLCRADSESQFVGCRFTLGQGGSFSYSLSIMSGKFLISDCVFGPTFGTWLSGQLGIGIADSNAVVINNVFVGTYSTRAILEIKAGAPNGFLIEGNTFADSRVGSGTCLQIDSNSVFHAGWGGKIRGNVFRDCYGDGPGANAIVSYQENRIENNRFIETIQDASGRPTVYIRRGEQSVLQNNIFVNTGFALSSTATTLDAERNYWGAAAGPYHATQNPAGRGDTIVGDNVDFTPWLLDTISGRISDSNVPLPAAYTLEVFPNPFNSTTTISYSLAKASKVKVEVFDVLGRLVAVPQPEAAASRIMSAGEHSVVFDGSNLASGIYFVRVEAGEVTMVRKMALIK